MVKLTTVSTGFEAKLIAARLGSDGVVWQLRGNVDGVYPMGPVDILVSAEDLATAREILLADDGVDGTDGYDLDEDLEEYSVADRAPLALWVIVAALCSASALAVAHMVLNGAN